MTGIIIAVQDRLQQPGPGRDQRGAHPASARINQQGRGWGTGSRACPRPWIRRIPAAPRNPARGRRAHPSPRRHGTQGVRQACGTLLSACTAHRPSHCPGGRHPSARPVVRPVGVVTTALRPRGPPGARSPRPVPPPRPPSSASGCNSGCSSPGSRRCRMGSHAQVKTPPNLREPQARGLLIRWFRVRAPGAPLLTRDFVASERLTAERVAVGFTFPPTAPARFARPRPS